MNIIQRVALRLAGITVKDLAALHPEAFTREILFSGNSDQAKDAAPQASNAYDEYAGQAWVYKATATVARSFRSVPLYVMRGEDWIEGHPLEALFAKPNPAMSGSALWEMWITDIYLAGETGLEVARNKRGEVSELWPRQGRYVTIDAQSSRYLRANGYTIKDGAGDPWTLSPEEFIWSRLYNPLSAWRGLGVYQAAALGILTDKQAQKYAASFFRGMARPDYVVTTPQGVTQTEKNIILEQIEAMTSGRNRGIVMEQGITDIKPLSFAPKDLIWETIRAMTREEIGAVAGVPGELMGDKSATYENRAEAVKSFWNDTVRPLGDWRDELLTGFFRGIGAIRPDESIESDYSDVEALEQSYNDRLTYATQLTALGVTLRDANEMFDLGIPDASLDASEVEPEPEPEPAEGQDAPNVSPPEGQDAPQKRYKYDGQPRDESGRFGEGGGGSDGGGGGSGGSGGAASLDSDALAKASEMGLNPAKISVVSASELASLGHPDALGDYDKKTGEIRVSASLPDGWTQADVIAHEGMHAKFEAFKSDRALYARHMGGANREALNEERNSPSDYSDAVWARASEYPNIHTGGGRVMFDHAVNESLAEMSRMGGKYPETPEAWGNLYDAVLAVKP